MATRRSLVDKVLSAGLGDVLRGHGFQKSRHTFRRIAGNCVQVTGIQGDRFNLPEDKSFTINLGVHFEGVDALTGQQRTASLFAEDAVLNIRIGTLTEKRSDKWWQIGNESEAERVAESAVEAWRICALPWFIQCETVEGAQRFAAERALFAPAFLLALVADDRKEAERWLGVIASSVGGKARDWYLGIAAKQGLSA